MFYTPESFFKIGLGREKESLQEFKCVTEHSKQTRTKTNMCVSTVETSVTAILTMFMERGEFSGHCYQPVVNHRELDVALFLHEHKNDKGVVQRPMMESHLVDVPDESFGLITPITFLPYEVRDDSDGLGIRSHGTLIGRRGSSSAVVQSTSFINGRTAYHISGIAFARVLEIFGYKWVAPDGEVRDGSVPPTVDELMEFLNLFGGHRLDTKDNFMSFVSAFGLQHFYQYNDGVDVWYNIRYLSEILRALTPFRLAVVDGQHRAVLMALFTCGYFSPSNEVVLDGSMTLSEALRGRQVDGDVGWGTAQVWCQAKICIGFAVDAEGHTIGDLRMSQPVLKKYGEVLTNAQAQSITFSWVQLYRDLLGILERAGNRLHSDHESVVRRLGIEFWRRSEDRPPVEGEKQKARPGCVNWYIYEKRLMSVLAGLVAYIEDNDSAAASLFHNPKQKDVSDTWQKATQSLFTSGGKLIIATDRKSTDAISMVLNLLKLFAFEPDLHQKLRLVTEIPDVQVVQYRTNVMKHISGFRSPWWLQTFVLGPAKVNHEIFLAKLLTERKIVEHIRAMSPITVEIKNILRQEIPDFSSLELSIPVDIADMKASKLKIKHTRGVTIMSKIQYAFSQTIIIDILETIGHYGYDPDLRTMGMKPEECMNFDWYIA